MKCGKCGKQFDEAVNGICPMCGQPYSRTGRRLISGDRGIRRGMVLLLLVIAATAAACNMKKRHIAGLYQIVDFESETAETGQMFQINGRRLKVEKAEVVDTSALSGMPKDQKLIAVKVSLMPGDGKRSITTEPGMIYLSDGCICRQWLDERTLDRILSPGEPSDGEEADYSPGEVLTEYDYADDVLLTERRGTFYFLMDEEVQTASISFDQLRREDGISVLEKRVSVPLSFEEGTP